MGMLEARVRILTNNTDAPVLSPQQVVSCSEYSQGKLPLKNKNTHLSLNPGIFSLYCRSGQGITDVVDSDCAEG